MPTSYCPTIISVVSLSHAANREFAANIPASPVPGFGRNPPPPRGRGRRRHRKSACCVPGLDRVVRWKRGLAPKPATPEPGMRPAAAPILECRSQGSKKLHDACRRLPRQRRSTRLARRTGRQRLRLGVEIDLRVHVRRVDAGVSQPSPYRVDINSGPKEVRRRRMSDRVRTDPLRSE